MSCRLGRKIRLVLLLAWLTLLPTSGPFPVNSQRRDMGASLRFARIPGVLSRKRAGFIGKPAALVKAKGQKPFQGASRREKDDTNHQILIRRCFGALPLLATRRRQDRAADQIWGRWLPCPWWRMTPELRKARTEPSRKARIRGSFVPGTE